MSTIQSPKSRPKFTYKETQSQLSENEKKHKKVKQFQLASCEIAEIHGKSRKIYSNLTRQIENSQDRHDLFNIAKCPCCGQAAEGEQYSFFCKANELFELGASFPLFFTLSKYLGIALLLSLLVACVPCMVNNYYQDGYSEWTHEKSFNVLTPGNFGRDLNVTFWQPILHVSVCGILVVFYVWIIRSIKEKSVEFDANLISPSDFTLMLRNLPAEYSKEELRKHIENNFQLKGMKIVNVVCTYDIKDYIECKNKLNDYKSQYILTKSYEKKYKKPLITKKCCKKVKLEGPKECKQIIKDLKSTLKCLKTKMKAEKLSPVAFIILNSQTNARFIASELERSPIQKIFDRIFPYFANKRQWFLGNYIQCEMAPDHSDINWENLSVRPRQKFIKRFCTIFIALLTLTVATAIMAGTSKWKAEVNSNKNNESADSIRASTIIPTIVTIFTNFLVARLIRIFSLQEKYATWTDYNGSVLDKLVVFYLLNNIGIPLFVYSDADTEWFIPGGLAYTVFWLQILNSSISPIIYLINPKFQLKKLTRYLLRKSEIEGNITVSQKIANQAFEGPEVDLADRFANIIKNFTMCLFFAPIVPIAVPISILGILLETTIFKFMLVKVHSKPKIYNSSLVIKAAEWMKWSLFIYSLGIFVFYQKLVNSLWVLELSFFIVMAGYSLTPISTICTCCFKDQTLEILERIFEGDSTHNDFFYTLPHFKSDFERENPATHEEGIKRWNNFMLDKTEDFYVCDDYVGDNLTVVEERNFGYVDGKEEIMVDDIVHDQ